MIILSKIIGYGVKITTLIKAHHYDIGVKGQCQLYLESVLTLIMRTPLSFLGLSVFKLSEIIGYGVKITTSIIWLVTMTLESKVNANYT